MGSKAQVFGQCDVSRSDMSTYENLKSGEWACCMRCLDRGAKRGL
uniref:Uncharacterized protein n=1 Tax=Anguilla anguilla TaxID=7936 RepID=A0A0E9PE38_ANGAN